MDSLFDLDLETKRSWTRPAAENRGYSAPSSESLTISLGVESATRMNDIFEAFNVQSIDVLRMKDYALPPGPTSPSTVT
jgi:hypothetical protein